MRRVFAVLLPVGLLALAGCVVSPRPGYYYGPRAAGGGDQAVEGFARGQRSRVDFSTTAATGGPTIANPAGYGRP